MHKEFTFQSHPSEDVLEEYAFRRLREEEIAPLEEHLLFCSGCQKALAEIDEYKFLMKTGTARLASAAAVRRQGWRRLVQPKLGWRTLAWGAAGAAACLLGVVYLNSQKTAVPVAVALASFRGAQDLNKAFHAPSRRPLKLQIDLSDAPAAASYRVEVVTAAGSRAWSGAPQLHDGKWEAAVSPGLARGLFWVRLYAANSPELLSEYPLRVD
ncbi:MAG TPA: hypothetical protein VKV74_13500 [Bryobacteraceae bacterium]|nr:hypothetical protein [Bryobacteraceae bacterium]